MPDSAVNPALQVADTADPAGSAGSRRTDAASPSPSTSKSKSAGRPAESDADAKLARAARSAQRLALLSRAPYGAPTLDLFAEDAERATLQAMNTDIRQSSLPGFELPEVFMAAVPGEDGSSGAGRAWRTGVLSVEGAVVSSLAVSRDDAAATQTDSQTADAATLDLMFDDVLAPHEAVAGPVKPDPLDEAAQGATFAAASGEEKESGQVASKRASAARGRGAARNVSATEPSPAAAMSEVERVEGKGGKGGPSDAFTQVPSGSPDASKAAAKPATAPSARDAARAAATPHRGQPQSLAAALIDDDRRTRTNASHAPQASSREASSELDTARATAYADTIDALYAVIADQRGAASALSRRVKTVLMIVICVLIVTVATGVAQSIALLRLARENTAQQQRIEQLMLTQQATLASFFDTDSSIVEVPNRGNANAAAANRNPDSAPPGRAAKRAQSKTH
ncbi:MAG: hypothetical protein QOJ04_4333 [Caballeronia sp.]|nr:hypothetical protein [Caballeronia sp.]